MSAPQSSHARGLLLTAIGGMALTIDIPLIKLSGGDAWSVLLLRSGATFTAALCIRAVWRARRAIPDGAAVYRPSRPRAGRRTDSISRRPSRKAATPKPRPGTIRDQSKLASSTALPGARGS